MCWITLKQKRYTELNRKKKKNKTHKENKWFLPERWKDLINVGYHTFIAF